VRTVVNLCASSLWALAIFLWLPGCGPGAPTALEGRIYFCQREGRSYSIYWTDPHGKRTVAVIRESEWARTPVPSPDGRRLAYLRGSPPRVHVRDLGTGEDVQVSTTRQTCAFPTWAPDGLRLAYLRLTPQGESEMVVQAVSGAAAKVIYTSKNMSSLSWSPLDDRIAFAEVDIEGNVAVWTVSPEGANLTRLMADVFQPAWDPLGRGLAVVARPANTLHFLDPRTRQLPVISSQPGASHPTWSPTGRQLAALYDGQIWVMNADGTQAVKITARKEKVLDPFWGKGL
jgi:Tol biopolymer transport system component